MLLVSPERLNNPRFRDEQLPRLADAVRAARRRRGALHQRLGPRLPARLPPHPRPARRRCRRARPVLATTATANARVVDRRRRAARGRRRDGAHRARPAGPRQPAARRAAAADRRSRGSAGWPPTSASCRAAASSTPSPSRPPRTPPRCCARPATRCAPTPAAPTRPTGSSSSGALRDNEVKALVATSALGHGLRQARPRLRRAPRRARVAGRLLPAGRPRRPRHRARRRAAAARRPRTATSGATSPPRRCRARTQADAVLHRAGRVRPSRCRRPRWRPSSTSAAPGSSCCSRCSTSTAPCSRVSAAAGSRPGEPWTYDAERYARVAAARERRAAARWSTTSGTDGCRMAFLQEALDDPTAPPTAAAATGAPGPGTRRDGARRRACRRPPATLRRVGVEIEPRAQWPSGMARLGVPVSGQDRRRRAGRAGPGGGPAHRPRLGPAAARRCWRERRPTRRPTTGCWPPASRCSPAGAGSSGRSPWWPMPSLRRPQLVGLGRRGTSPGSGGCRTSARSTSSTAGRPASPGGNSAFRLAGV